MLDISQKFAGSVIILQDITAYQKAIDAAQEADRAKSVFLDTVSHEIRTPINSILGLTRLLEDENPSDGMPKHLRSIRASAVVLSALIENVLGLSRAETNALQLVEQDFNLAEMCSALAQVLELEERKRPVTLETRICPDVPTQLLGGDGHKLRHVLMNLLSNGLKYTEKGGTVTLTVSKTGADDDKRTHLHFEVTDTGCGIPEHAVDTLFDPFVQTGGAKDGSATAGGSGLGLAISRHLVEFLGGHIAYRANPSGGSIFGFDLAFDLSRQPSSFPEHASGHNILVVEDDPVNAIVIEGYLAELGNTVTLAGNYADAIASLNGGAPFDIVVTDYKLGTHTGLDVVKAVRETAQDMGTMIPVLVVTAAIPHDVVQQLKQSQAGLFLEKPFSRYELANALSTISKGLPKNKKRPERPSTSALSNKDLNRLLSDLGFERCNASYAVSKATCPA